MNLKSLAADFRTPAETCPVCGCYQPQSNIESNHCYICKPDKSLSMRVECVHPIIQDGEPESPKFAVIHGQTAIGIDFYNKRYFDTLESLMSQLKRLGLRINNNGAVSTFANSK